ncbi:MAG: serine/threonine-protein kinase PknK, partial [Leptospiraceae bacterium]|nr:serine/threonine-protein kinase PknK [Leptospiraceae bacterium]
MKIHNFNILTELFEGTETILYRAQKDDNSEPVILKLARSQSSFYRLVNEYEILSEISINEVPKILGFHQDKDNPFLVLSDLGGYPLSNFVDKVKNFPLKKILKIFINIVLVLDKVHKNKIIHKDIKPSNILYKEEDDSISIVDFGISTIYDIKLNDYKSIKHLEGTIQYISPEQTGRINRTIDSRSDLYSLGITFYLLLSGKLPFLSEDPIDLIYSHISRKPPKLENIHPLLGDIVLKLLSKNPENRYQSTYGLLNDLRKLETGNNEFDLATKDFLTKVRFSDKIFGRFKEIELLNFLMERSIREPDSTTFLFITGEAGSGKSSLIDELKRKTNIEKGFFLKGKHDQIQKNIPYSSFSQILKKYLELIYSENKLIQNDVKNNLKRILGDNTGLFKSIVPELQDFLEEFSSPSPLEGGEAYNRFNVYFINLLKEIVSHVNPFVIALDDLQWADSATINLVKKIIQEKNIPGLFFVIGFRDNEKQVTPYFNDFR